jgi:UDP-glucose 4-epimerase
MESVLVTGSSGGIGQALVPFLANLNFRVIGLDIRSPISEIARIQNFDFIQGDINKGSESLARMVHEIDYVVHLAAISSLPECEEEPSKAFETNFMGTVRLAELFSQSKITKFINASTSAVYEGVEKLPFLESQSCDPHLIYPQTKFMAEKYLLKKYQTRNFPAVSLRFFNVIGPYQDYTRLSPPLVNYLVREYLHGRRPILHSDGHQERDYISVYDICNAIYRSMKLESSLPAIFNICSGETLTVRELDSLIRHELNTALEPVYRNSDRLWDDYHKLFVGNYKLKRETIANETTKKSVGSAELFKKIAGWKIEYPVKRVIGQICEETQNHMMGQA